MTFEVGSVLLFSKRPLIIQRTRQSERWKKTFILQNEIDKLPIAYLKWQLRQSSLQGKTVVGEGEGQLGLVGKMEIGRLEAILVPFIIRMASLCERTCPPQIMCEHVRIHRFLSTFSILA
jgi:hypothetical protein